MTMQSLAHGVRTTLAYVLATAILGCLIAVLAYSGFAAVFYAGKVIEILALGGKERQVATALAWLGVPLTALYVLHRRKREFPPYAFLAAYVLAATALCLAYTHKIHPQFVSDFKRMWEAATAMASAGLHPASDIIEQRALLVLYPTVEVLGPTPNAMQFVNTAMFAAIGLFGYDVLRSGRGHRIAQACALVWLSSFEPVMAIAIPTHDLWGLFFLAAAAWAAARACNAFVQRRGRAQLVGWAALFGTLLALLQVQREVGVVLLIAALLTLACLAAWNRCCNRSVIGPIAALLLAYGLTGGVLSLAGARAPAQGQQDLDTARLAGFSASFSSGRFYYGLAVRKTFLDPVSREEAQSLAHAILLSDLAEQPGRRIASVTRRLAALAQPGSQLNFYAAGEPRAAIQTLQVFLAMSALAVFGLASVAIARLLRPARRHLLPVTAMLVLFAGGMIAICCVLSEMQPRYVFFMWFIGAMLVAEGFFGERNDDASQAP